jgi:hypothetical protein
VNAARKYNPAMATVLSNYVLYRDVPQRNYLQIAAKREDNGSFLMQVWEGTVIDVEPFDHVNPGCRGCALSDC